MCVNRTVSDVRVFALVRDFISMAAICPSVYLIPEFLNTMASFQTDVSVFSRSSVLFCCHKTNSDLLQRRKYVYFPATCSGLEHVVRMCAWFPVRIKECLSLLLSLFRPFEFCLSLLLFVCRESSEREMQSERG